MSRFYTLLCLLLLAEGLLAQDKTLATYRRSSLYTIMLDETKLPNANVIKNAFDNAPVPDKFNDHNLDQRSFDPKEYLITDEDRIAAGVPETGKADSTSANTKDANDLMALFHKIIVKKHIARDIVAKWYGRQADSTFSTDLIAERGSYDATEMQAGIAAKSARGLSLLKDAGQELIGNTFVVGVRFSYVDKKDVAEAVNKVAGLFSNMGGIAGLASSLTQMGATMAGRGYVVKTTACLYKLMWDEKIQSDFENDCWNNPARFDTTSLFKLEPIGTQTSWADVQSSAMSTKSESQLIERATVRSIDAVISKLQHNFEVFRTKTPLISTEPEITAQIGMKEGVENGSKFEVLEQLLDPESGVTSYKRVGVISAEKNKIWDNRHNAGEEQTETNKSEGPTITTFKGNNKHLYPGMLIRQIN